jgi:hypothetical protein
MEGRRGVLTQMRALILKEAFSHKEGGRGAHLLYHKWKSLIAAQGKKTSHLQTKIGSLAPRVGERGGSPSIDRQEPHLPPRGLFGLGGARAWHPNPVVGGSSSSSLWAGEGCGADSGCGEGGGVRSAARVWLRRPLLSRRAPRRALRRPPLAGCGRAGTIGCGRAGGGGWRCGGGLSRSRRAGWFPLAGSWALGAGRWPKENSS